MSHYEPHEPELFHELGEVQTGLWFKQVYGSWNLTKQDNPPFPQFMCISNPEQAVKTTKMARHSYELAETEATSVW